MLKVLFIFLLSFNAYAILEFEDATFPEIVTSARGLAMGNAYMSKVDDSWASFYNPAGLGSVRGLQIHLLNFQVEYNNDILQATTGDGNFASNSANFTKVLSATGTRELLADNPGSLFHGKYSLFPNITYRGLTLGYVYAKQNRSRLLTSTSDIEFAERLDSGPLMSLSFSLFGGVIKFGASAMYLTREQMQKDFAPADPVTIDKDTDYVKGSMTYITAGFRLTLPIALLPTFSAVLRNSTNTKFSNAAYSGIPDKIPQTLDAGMSITPFTGQNARMHIEVVARDLGSRYEDVPAQRKIQAGVEFDWARTLFFRLGYGDGWGSGGVGLRTRTFIFDLSTYGVEISEDGVRENEDRRTVLSIARGF